VANELEEMGKALGEKDKDGAFHTLAKRVDVVLNTIEQQYP
jgi:hypothetical protein